MIWFILLSKLSQPLQKNKITTYLYYTPFVLEKSRYLLYLIEYNVSCFLQTLNHLFNYFISTFSLLLSSHLSFMQMGYLPRPFPLHPQIHHFPHLLLHFFSYLILYAHLMFPHYHSFLFSSESYHLQ